MKYTEQALGFECAGEHLMGILSLPQTVMPVAVLVVVGGPQYRAGSHRQFVLLARALASAGYATLRFDYRGMGDSSGPLHNFEEVSADTAAAIDALARTVPCVSKVVLWGLCDGASAALLYLDGRPDPRVAGLCLANPWVRTQASLAATHVKHYYLKRLRERAFWMKLLAGGVALRALAELLRNLWRARRSGIPGDAQSALPYQQRMARAWLAFDGPVLLLMSELDYTAREFEEQSAADPAWRRAFARRAPRRVVLHGADHTFSMAGSQAAAELATIDWLNATFAGAGG